jgi:hypothetical protein
MNLSPKNKEIIFTIIIGAVLAFVSYYFVGAWIVWGLCSSNTAAACVDPTSKVVLIVTVLIAGILTAVKIRSIVKH